MKKEEFFKLGLSEELAVKCAEASKKELEGYVPKEQFDEVKQSKENLENEVNERDAQLETLKKSTGDVESLKATIEELQEQNKASETEYQENIKKLKIDNAIELAIKSAGGKNSVAIKALLDSEKIKVDEDGKVVGIEKQVKELVKGENSSFLLLPLVF